jgi:hypothetical protein
MKNIQILSTDEQIKNVGDVVKDLYGDTHIFTKNDGKEYGKTTTKLNIYITSDEEIKEGDWIFDIVTKRIEIAKFNHNDLKRDWKKIILTTDQDLIKDGVQAIDDDFLEWFLKNPSCEEIKVEKYHGIKTSIAEISAVSGNDDYDWQGIGDNRDYRIIIPKEEPNIIDFLKNNCDPEIAKQVEKETKQFEEKQSQMSNEELILLAKEEVSKLCKTGGKSITMCVPPTVKDTDMIICELIKRFEALTIFIKKNTI